MVFRRRAGSASRTARRLAASLLIGLAASVATGGCNRRPAGTCGEDIDCAPGFDCRAGACVRRPRLEQVGPAPQSAGIELPAAPEPRPTLDQAPDAAVEQPSDPAGADRGAKAPRPSRPQEVQPPPTPPAPPTMPGPEPRWKQRLKNS